MQKSRVKDPQTDRALQQIYKKLEPTEFFTNTPQDTRGGLGDWGYYYDGTNLHFYIKLPKGWYEFGSNLTKVNP